jgi:HTH-type transcriptional regulator, competence development regulator
MQFGDRVRTLRNAASLTQREVATRLGVSTTYISKVENEKLHFGDYPSEKFIHRLAGVLRADESELMLLAGKIPEQIRRRVTERPDVFLALAGCDDKALDRVKVQVATLTRRKKGKPRKPR